MGYTHYDKVSGVNGLGVGAKDSEVTVADSSGNLYQAGTQVTASAAELNIMDGVTASAAELNLNDGAVAGTAVASKTLALGTNKNVDVLAVADLKLGAGAGTSVTATAAELNYNAGVTPGTVTASKTLMVGANQNVDTLAIADGGLKLGAGAGTAVTATATELNAVADVSVNGAVAKVKKLSISATPTGAEQDTTFDLPAKAVILDVFVDVTTAEATGTTKTIDVGLLSSESGGDADGFLDGIDVSATGLKRGVPVYTAGGTETYLSDTTTGALRRIVYLAGANVTGDTGTYHERPHLSDSVTAKSVTYTAGSGNFAEFRGAIYIVYVELG